MGTEGGYPGVMSFRAKASANDPIEWDVPL